MSPKQRSVARADSLKAFWIDYKGLAVGFHRHQLFLPPPLRIPEPLCSSHSFAMQAIVTLLLVTLYSLLQVSAAPVEVDVAARANNA